MVSGKRSRIGTDDPGGLSTAIEVATGLTFPGSMDIQLRKVGLNSGSTKSGEGHFRNEQEPNRFPFTITPRGDNHPRRELAPVLADALNGAFPFAFVSVAASWAAWWPALTSAGTRSSAECALPTTSSGS
jgi:hypothetical protein